MVTKLIISRQIGNVFGRIEKTSDEDLVYYRWFIYYKDSVMKGDPEQSLMDAERELKSNMMTIQNLYSKMKMTKDKIKMEIRIKEWDGTCPKCNSSNVEDNGDISAEGGETCRAENCNNCGFKFSIKAYWVR